MPTPITTVSPFQNAITEAYGHNFKGQTYTATAAITAGQVCAFTGNRTVGPAASGSLLVAGVALHDCANGGIVTVAKTGTWFITAAGAITFGQRLIVGAVAGTVAAAGATPDARTVFGFAEESIADTASGRVTLVLG
jgi:hypothetical protein